MPPTDTPSSSVSSSRHFHLTEIGDGIYAAIADPRGSAVCNAGIVDLGGATLVFDTFQTPLAARDLLAVAQTLFGRPVAYVVNSHWHGDHMVGNVVFPAETPILATAKTRELIATLGEEELRSDREGMGTFITALETQHAQAADDATRARLAERLVTAREYADALTTLTLRLPNQTFEDRMMLTGTRRSAELLTYGGGHTDSDALLYLPADGVAFLGDLLFVGVHPWLPDGSPEEWIRILDEAHALEVRTAVPGHGAVGAREDYAPVQRYIAEAMRLAREVAQGGGTVEEVLAAPLPSEFAAWQQPQFFAANMRFLFARATSMRP